MRGWMSIAYLAKPKNLNGGLVARGASGLPFVLHPGLTLAVVPPQLDAPRTLTVSEVTERAENEALVFFDEVSDLSSAELLAGCELLAREEDIDASVLEEAEALPAWEGWSVHDERAGYVGEVVEVAERATQPLLTVRRAEGGEALIPLVDEFIGRCGRGRPPHRCVPARRPARSVGRPARRLLSARPRHPSTGDPMLIETLSTFPHMYGLGHGRVLNEAAPRRRASWNFAPTTCATGLTTATASTDDDPYGGRRPASS